MNSVRSYANSYLYTRIPDYERSVFEFVMKADRIDKNADTFTGVIEDVKRRQTSAVLSRVLMRDDVVLCVNNKPLPASFKVFAAKDVRTDQSVKVFIDLSGLITLKNGYYVINKIDIFCSYLLSAMTNIIYNENMAKICSNSMIIQSGTECFVNLSSHIFDYLRANGYSENKNKIAYIFAMYFQCTILGLDRDSSSVKALAAKIADIPSRDINAMELYYDDSVLTNINTLVTCVTDTFKMKGVGTDTFVEKWTWFYGVGTQFGTELFPAFASMITDAYCGAYVNNQKTIEKCCGKAMVNFTTAMLKIGSDTIEVGFRYESTIDREMYDHNITTMQETASLKRELNKHALRKGDIKNQKLVEEKYKWSSNAYNKLGMKVSDLANQYLTEALDEMEDCMAKGNCEDYDDFLSKTVDLVGKDLCSSDREGFSTRMVKDVNGCSKIKINNPDIKVDKVIPDIKASITVVDPDNPACKKYNGYENDLEDDEVEDYGITDESGIILESKKILGYRGTKKVEKKYDIPDDCCIENKDIAGCNSNMDVVNKAGKAVRYIKDQEDINKYFYSLLKSVCYYLMILKEDQLNMHAASKGLYNLYKKSYKGDNPIDLKKVFRSVIIKLGGTMVGSAAVGGIAGTAIGTAVGKSMFKSK